MVDVQLTFVAVVAPNVTFVAPTTKFEPVIVTTVPPVVGPVEGLIDETTGVQPALRKMETLGELAFATARSLRASPLKSPMTTEYRFVPSPMLVTTPKEPVPVPSRIEILFESPFTTAEEFTAKYAKSVKVNSTDRAEKFSGAELAADEHRPAEREAKNLNRS